MDVNMVSCSFRDREAVQSNQPSLSKSLANKEFCSSLHLHTPTLELFFSPYLKLFAFTLIFTYGSGVLC